MNSFKRKLAAGAIAASLVLPSAVWAAEGKDTVLDSIPLYEIGTLSGTGDMGAEDGEALSATYRQPSSVVASAGGSIIVTDSGNQKIRAITKSAVSTIAGIDLGLDDYGFNIGGYLDGSADRSVFHFPSGAVVDRNGRVIIADSENHAVRAVTKDGKVTTIAGNGLIGSEDGDGSEARFYYPSDVAVTASGTIYVADTLNHVIRKIESGKVTTLNAASLRAVEHFPGDIEPAGDFKDGKLAEALFNEPSGLALDAKGNLYVSDTGNQRIRYIDFAAGTVSTVAGGGSLAPDAPYVEGEYADGKALEARFNAPRGLTVTPDGGILIADSLNHAIRYLKDGIVTTAAGVPTESGKFDGLAAYAGFSIPTDVAYIDGGSIVVADQGNNRVRIVSPYQKPAGLAGPKVEIVYGNDVIPTDADPILRNGTTFVPVRVITETLGFSVDYGDDGVTTVKKGSQSYKITAGSKTISTSGGDVTLTEAPFIQGNRLFLPVRFFAEQIDLDVQWLSEDKAVLLRHKLVVMD